MNTAEFDPKKKIAYGVEELCAALDMGRTTFYRLVDEEVFNPFKMGSKTKVDAREVEAYIERLKAEAAEERARKAAKKAA